MPLLHSSRRRPSPLKYTDYDHEISLIDHTAPSSRRQSRSPFASPRPGSPGTLSDSSSRRHSDAHLRKHRSALRRELTKRKYLKYQDRRLEGLGENGLEEQSSGDEEYPDRERGRGRAISKSKKGKINKEPESAIDVLFENQRGGLCCGIRFFSGRALGSIDLSPWTNIAQKTSPTDITNAQVPNPSWEWAWNEWYINHTDKVDDDGWDYSFAFSKKFSWHGPSWWNSFVRRRAWIRKRVMKHTDYHVQEGHMLNADYFIILPAEDRSRGRGPTMEKGLRDRSSARQFDNRGIGTDNFKEDICDIDSLMEALRFSRIDREKMEAVENFIEHGGDELYSLRERIHDIMGMFIFQASRRRLLSHLLKIFNEACDEQKQNAESDNDPYPAKQRRLYNLEAAVQNADEEVKKLEFWSDVKRMVEKGETKGAIDDSQGWDKTWTGLDHSGPEDVISNRNIPGKADCKKGEGNGAATSPGLEKGKGKANE